MITPLHLRSLFRGLIAAGGALLLGLASGCSVGYPETMEYGLRDDVLVIKTPEKQPERLDPPGAFATLIPWIERDGGKTFNPAALTSLDRVNSEGAPEGKKNVSGDLLQALNTQFGTPFAPRVGPKPKPGEEPVAPPELRLEAATLAEGSVLYRRNCLHCHGLTGNGQGPTGPWVNPHPRDYRRGIFKFVSTKTQGRKPSREDLLRVLRQGVDGTSMPAFGAVYGGPFGVLGDHELNALASYVMHLSIRGQVEFELMVALGDEAKSQSRVEIKEAVPERLTEILGQWSSANESSSLIIPVNVEPTKDEAATLEKLAKSPPAEGETITKQIEALVTSRPFAPEDLDRLLKPLAGVVDLPEIKKKALMASIERGHTGFIEKCGSCHLDYGRKDNWKWDEWGTIVRPANLTLGMYRGGRRPVDLFWRIHSGIPGAQMSGNGEALAAITVDGKAEVQPWRVWDVVNFVEALPYRGMLPPKLAEMIHPQHQGKGLGARD